MGMFDSVYVPCPRCTKPTEFQSKAGECSLTIYRLDQAPPEILADLYAQSGERCPECDHYFRVQRPAEPKKDEAKVQRAADRIAMCSVTPGQVWRHNKTKSNYEIVCLSIDEARLVVLVTYRSLLRDTTWTRDLDVFLGPNEDGEQRFEHLDPGEAHYADAGVRCKTCGSADLEPRGLGGGPPYGEIFFHVCLTCGANPA